MKSLSFNGIKQLLLLIVVFALSFQVIPAWVPVLRKEWLLLLVASFLLVVTHSKTIGQEKIFAVWIIYTLVVFFKATIKVPMFPNYPIAVYEVLLMFFSAFLPLTILSSNNQKFMRIVLIGSFLFLLVETIGSFFVLKLYPGAIRNMYAFIQEEGTSAGYELYRFGLADYGFCHGLPVLVPPLFYLLKSNDGKKIKLLSIIALVLCVFLVWMSESTTALLLVFVMVALGFFTRESKNNKNSVVIFLVLILPLLISDTIQLNVLDAIGSIVGRDSESGAKLMELEHSIAHNEQTGDLESRMDKYTTSIEMFLTSPIWGTSGLHGRHSALLDRLAVLGLLGFVPLILFFVEYFKKIYHIIPSESKVFFLEALFAGIVILLSKSMWLWSVFFVFFIVMPFLFLYDFNKTK